MPYRAPGVYHIPQWAITNRLLTAYDITFDLNGEEVSRARMDLNNSTVYFTVRDVNGILVIEKDSTASTEIGVRTQGGPTKGQAIVKFVEADTTPLSSDPRVKYWFDAWVQKSTGEEPVIDRGRFYVDKSSTRISDIP